jgi:multidrug efflux pump subunit AcrB
MWISDTSIKRPVFATMFILSFVVLGIVSLSRLGIDLFPAVDFPFVNISTVYPGASPEEVETLVTKPIEDAVAGIEGVKRVESNSSEGFSRVGIEFKLGLDPQGSAAEVREKVAAIRFRLPKEVEDPTIARFDVAALPVSTYAVSSALPADKTRLIVEDQVKPLLQQVDGVAGVEVNGGLGARGPGQSGSTPPRSTGIAHLHCERGTCGREPRRAGRHRHRRRQGRLPADEGRIHQHR